MLQKRKKPFPPNCTKTSKPMSVEFSDGEENAELETSFKRKRRLRTGDQERDVTGDEDVKRCTDGDISPDNTTNKNQLQKVDLTSNRLKAEVVDSGETEKDQRNPELQKKFDGINQNKLIVIEDGTPLASNKSLILDSDAKNEEPHLVQVHEKLVNVLKPHQVEGIQFMYDCVVGTLEQFRVDDDGGGGCILAHCCGLGKTLQVIAFLHTIMKHDEISKKISKVLVIVPKNVVLNWQKEFKKWLPVNRDFGVYELDSFKEHRDRLKYLQAWKEQSNSAVMIVGYDMFRILTQSDDDKKSNEKENDVSEKPKTISDKQAAFLKLQSEFRRLLQNPGPDLIVCDEAHKLKNNESLLARTMLKIKTKRRICLTGTPLQNNLNEYFVMVSFVKPHLLGTKAEFKTNFESVIENGRTKDASELEVLLMRKRCIVLFEKLSKIVQRKDISVLKQSIPEKLEYVINVRLTLPQFRLYDKFLTMISRSGGVKSQKRLLSDYHTFSRIWTHPYQLINNVRENGQKNFLGEDLDGFIVEDDEEESSIASGVVSSDDKKPTKDDSSRASPPPSNDKICGWWSELVSDADKFNLKMSNKLLILFDIMKRCEAIGDKLLVFSQSLESLRIIRCFLEEYDKTNSWFADGHECLDAKGEKWGWKQGYDFLQIDGSVSSHEREHIQTQFNKKTNLRVRLLLISTRAGSLGTNMVAANRVVIFDSCWNPSHDTQSLFRVYRIGQVKPVYIYRLVAHGTMEEVIYKRQVTKDSTSQRCLDEKQVQRHFLDHDLKKVYALSFIAYNKKVVFSNAPPKDRLLAELLSTRPAAIVNYILHDNLFENFDGEALTVEEREQALREYKIDKSKPRASIPQNDGVSKIIAMQNSAGTMLIDSPRITTSRVLNGVSVDAKLVAAVKEDFIYSLCSLNGFNPMQCTKVVYTKIILQNLPNDFSADIPKAASTVTQIVTEEGHLVIKQQKS